MSFDLQTDVPLSPACADILARIDSVGRVWAQSLVMGKSGGL